MCEPSDHKPKSSGCKGWVPLLLELEIHNPPMLLPSLSLHHLHQHWAKCGTERTARFQETHRSMHTDHDCSKTCCIHGYQRCHASSQASLKKLHANEFFCHHNHHPLVNFWESEPEQQQHFLGRKYPSFGPLVIFDIICWKTPHFPPWLVGHHHRSIPPHLFCWLSLCCLELSHGKLLL